MDYRDTVLAGKVEDHLEQSRMKNELLRYKEAMRDIRHKLSWFYEDSSIMNMTEQEIADEACDLINQYANLLERLDNE